MVVQTLFSHIFSSLLSSRLSLFLHLVQFLPRYFLRHRLAGAFVSLQAEEKLLVRLEKLTQSQDVTGSETLSQISAASI